MAYILEETKGNLPLWLAPVQVNVIPVNNEYHLEYSRRLFDRFNDENIRCELDDRDEKLGYRMRESQTKKIPYTLVIGDKERDNNVVTYRKFGQKESTTVSIDEFINMIHDEIRNKASK